MVSWDMCNLPAAGLFLCLILRVQCVVLLYRINKKNSQKDMEQKKNGNYFFYDEEESSSADVDDDDL
jgi:hypothetical protein